jgi:hypothetical protein
MYLKILFILGIYLHAACHLQVKFARAESGVKNGREAAVPRCESERTSGREKCKAERAMGRAGELHTRLRGY